MVSGAELVSIGIELLDPPVGELSSVVAVLGAALLVMFGNPEVSNVVGATIDDDGNVGSGGDVKSVVGATVLPVPVGPSKPVLVLLHGYGASVPVGL